MYSDAQRIAAKYGITDLPVSPKPTPAPSGKANGLDQAIEYEQLGQYDKAIDSYLALSVADCGGEDQYDKAIERAVKVCITYRSQRLPDVVNAFAEVMIELKRHGSLGRILEGIEAYPDAFETYKAGGMWEDANRLAEYLEPEEQAQFRREYQDYLAKNQNTKGLMGLGQIDAALAVYASNGEWETCLKQVQQQGDQYVEKYTMSYAQDLVNRHKYDDAISVLAKYSPSTKSQNIPTYIQLCQPTVYSVPSYDQVQPSFYASANTRMLFPAIISVLYFVT
jgi:intraflagellar transport protein 172